MVAVFALRSYWRIKKSLGKSVFRKDNDDDLYAELKATLKKSFWATLLIILAIFLVKTIILR